MYLAIDDSQLENTLREHLRLEFLGLRKRLTLSTIPVAAAFGLTLALSQRIALWRALAPAGILCAVSFITFEVCVNRLTTQSGILRSKMRLVLLLDLATGIGWSLFAWFVIPSSSSTIAWQSVAVLVGIVSLSISVNAPSPKNFGVFAGPILAALFTTLVVRHESAAILVAVTIFAIVLSEAFWAAHQTNRSANVERIRAAELTHRLERALQTTEHESLHDPLTGLGNRRYLTRQAERPVSDTTVLCIDLDHFKLVNDRYGHAVGDEMLIVVATRIAAQIRADDQVVRLGGDEFIVVAHGDQSGAGYIADRVLGALCDPYQLTVGTIHAGASIGLAVGHEGERLEQVQHRADAALYQAKARGRNQVVVARPEGMVDLTSDRSASSSFLLPDHTPDRWSSDSVAPA